jgi:hypothetical protein
MVGDMLADSTLMTWMLWTLQSISPAKLAVIRIRNAARLSLSCRRLR